MHFGLSSKSWQQFRVEENVLNICVSPFRSPDLDVSKRQNPYKGRQGSNSILQSQGGNATLLPNLTTEPFQEDSQLPSGVLVKPAIFWFHIDTCLITFFKPWSEPKMRHWPCKVTTYGPKTAFNMLQTVCLFSSREHYLRSIQNIATIGCLMLENRLNPLQSFNP